jgi:hypothetical protein
MDGEPCDDPKRVDSGIRATAFSGSIPANNTAVEIDLGGPVGRPFYFDPIQWISLKFRVVVALCARRLLGTQHCDDDRILIRWSESRGYMSRQEPQFPYTAIQETGTMDWADMIGTAHFVQFYDDQHEIVEAVARYFIQGLRLGESCIMIADADKDKAVLARMRELDPALLNGAPPITVMDARETLAKFLVDGMPREDLFDQTVGAAVRDAAAAKRPVRAFGEMVAILTAEGHAPAALRLEELWNDLGSLHHFRLFCAYSNDCLTTDHARPHARALKDTHSHVVGVCSPAFA